MHQPQTFILLLAGLLCLSSCGGGGGGGGGGQSEQSGGGSNEVLTYDNEVTSAEKTKTNEALNSVKAMNIDGANIKKFSQVFGGTSSESVLSYLDTRVNYIISTNTDLNQRISISGAFQYAESLVQAETVATNIGTALWFQNKIESPQELTFEINGKPIPIPSSRIGIIQLGDIYTRLDQLVQQSTIVHEARHSDCTGGVYASDIEKLRNNQIPEHHQCGHIHDLCPPGHPLEGVYACDTHPWGAYAVHFLYAGSVALACTNCNEQQKTVAEQEAIEASSRLLFDVNDMLDGNLGNPDMSSSTQVR